MRHVTETSRILLLTLLLPLYGCLDSVTPPGGNGSGCKAAADCTDAAPICDPVSKVCRTCSGPMDDAACKTRNAIAPRCGVAGKCIPACTGAGQAADCTDPLKPSCTAGTCAACGQPGDCTSSVCNDNGSCSAAADVIYVDNKSGTCDPQKTHKGTQTDAFCDVQAGADYARNNGKSVVAIAASNFAYSPVIISATPKPLTIVGAGLSGAQKSTLRKDASAITVYGGAAAVNVTITGVDLGSTGTDAVVCDKGTGLSAPQLTLRTSNVHDSIGLGVNAKSCVLALDRVRVYSNKGGLRLNNTTYTVSNTMVYDNLGNGVSITTPGPGSTFRFNTVYGNTLVGASGAGIACDKPDTAIEYSIVSSNFGGPSQFSGCKLQSIVTGTETISGGVAKVPEFVNPQSPFDLHLKLSQANKDCCIDKVTSTGQILVDHDIDGTKRPQGASWDIGAHEVQQ